MEFDASGVLVAFKEPLIHMYNKDDQHVTGTPYASEVVSRPNVLLLGDSLGDAKMAKREHTPVLPPGYVPYRCCGNVSRFPNYDTTVIRRFRVSES